MGMLPAWIIYIFHKIHMKIIDAIVLYVVSTRNVSFPVCSVAKDFEVSSAIAFTGTGTFRSTSIFPTQ